MTSLSVEVPRKLIPLLQPMRFKALHGGRGGSKSHFFAEQIVLRCLQPPKKDKSGLYNPTRVVCIREIQKSIKDSVKQLILDKIRKLGVQHLFDALGADNDIRGPHGSLIIFRGMQSYSADTIKSLEGYDLAWVEEAQTLSGLSLELLVPTIRKEYEDGTSSELWFSWNPRFKTDPVDMFFRKSPPPNAIVVEINWWDNPWFPDVLHQQMLHDFTVDEDKADHVWGGSYGSTQGAILAKWVNKAHKDKRITDEVAYDPSGAPIEISSDIGFRDTATWWFWQRKVGGFTCFKVMKGSGMDAEDWVDEIEKALEEIGVSVDMLGKIWLPHDARIKTFQSKHSSLQRFITKFGMSKMGIVPQSKKSDQISAARFIIDRTEFNATECADGLDGLEAWEFEYNEETQIFSREPLHNWACFVPGTLVKTYSGEIPIEDILPTDGIVTPGGLRSATDLHRYIAPDTISISLADGRKVETTANHKFFTSKGLVRADALSYDDRLFNGNELSWRMISWILKAAGTTGMYGGISDSCRPKNSDVKESSTDSSIETYMLDIMARSLMDMKSTTLMETQAITILPTFNASQFLNTSHYTGQRTVDAQPRGTKQMRGGSFIPNPSKAAGLQIETPSWKPASNLLSWLGQLQLTGMVAKKVSSGIHSTGNPYGVPEKRLPRYVRFAVRTLLHIGHARNTAGRIVELKRNEGERPVYDMTVEHDHCFIANGILTSNSHFGDGFAYGCQVMQGLSVAAKPEQQRNLAIQADGAGPSTMTLDDAWGTQTIGTIGRI